MSSILRAGASARLLASLASPPSIIHPNSIRVFSTGTTPPPPTGPEATASAGGKSWWTKAKPSLFGGAVGGAITAVVGVLGIYLTKHQYEAQQPEYKIAQTKKSVEATFKRPAVPIKPSADLGEARITKSKRSNRPDVMYNPNFGSIPKLQWDQKDLRNLLLHAGVIFFFKDSGSGKTTSVKAMVDSLNGTVDDGVASSSCR